MVKIKEIPLKRLMSQKALLALAKKLEVAEIDKNAIQVFVGMSTCGRASGAEETYAVIKYELEKHGIDKDRVELIQTGCVGLCHAEPIVEVQYHGRKRITFDSV